MAKSGIPVPATIPDESRAFVLCVPDSPEFYGIVMGAIKTMTFGYYWQGTPEQIEAVTTRMKRMYYDYQEQVGCMICDMVAECFESGNEALIEALAEALRSNPVLAGAIADAMARNGSYTPGRPLTPGQSATSILPPNVKDEFGNCIDDNLWGAMLYLVQSGNRLISDFFEVLEVLSNTIERMEVVSKAIPAAGDYISAAAGFADQLAEEIAEAYAGAYTEAYEQSLACDLFCASRETCELSLDVIMNVLNGRLSAPMDIGDFGEIMAGIATGSWVGDEIADVAFLCFFGALKFGQQFGDTLGIRPLPVLMSLGADQLASDNWEVLCDCNVPEFTYSQYDQYTGGTPVSVETVPYGEYEFDSIPEPANPGHHTLRLHFSPQVKVTVVSTDWTQVLGTIPTGEVWFDQIVGGVYSFWNAGGYVNNTTVPYKDITNMPSDRMERLFQVNGVPFSVTLLIEPDV